MLLACLFSIILSILSGPLFHKRNKEDQRLFNNFRTLRLGSGQVNILNDLTREEIFFFSPFLINQYPTAKETSIKIFLAALLTLQFLVAPASAKCDG